MTTEINIASSDLPPDDGVAPQHVSGDLRAGKLLCADFTYLRHGEVRVVPPVFVPRLAHLTGRSPTPAPRQPQPETQRHGQRARCGVEESLGLKQIEDEQHAA